MSTHRFLPVALALCALLFLPPSANPDSLPNIEITALNGSAQWGDFTGGCAGICVSLSAPGFALNFQGVVSSGAYTLSPGDPLMTYFALVEPSGAPRVPDATVTINGGAYPVAFPEGSVNLIAPTIIVPSGYATIQLPTFLTGTGTACTAVYGVDGCSPPPDTTPYPLPISYVSLFVEGHLTLTFRPGPGPAPLNEEFAATFTPIPEPATLMLFAILAPLTAGLALRCPLTHPAR